MTFYHEPTPAELSAMDPAAVFIWLTQEIYDARIRGDAERPAVILSAFDPDARRCLCIGAAALRVMDGTADTEYRDALRSAMAETLYNKFRQEVR